jgi:hypothetical protein
VASSSSWNNFLFHPSKNMWLRRLRFHICAIGDLSAGQLCKFVKFPSLLRAKFKLHSFKSKVIFLYIYRTYHNRNFRILKLSKSYHLDLPAAIFRAHIAPSAHDDVGWNDWIWHSPQNRWAQMWSLQMLVPAWPMQKARNLHQIHTWLLSCYVSVLKCFVILV